MAKINVLIFRFKLNETPVTINLLQLVQKFHYTAFILSIKLISAQYTNPQKHAYKSRNHKKQNN